MLQMFQFVPSRHSGCDIIDCLKNLGYISVRTSDGGRGDCIIAFAVSFDRIMVNLAGSERLLRGTVFAIFQVGTPQIEAMLTKQLSKTPTSQRVVHPLDTELRADDHQTLAHRRDDGFKPGVTSRQFLVEAGLLDGHGDAACKNLGSIDIVFVERV